MPPTKFTDREHTALSGAYLREILTGSREGLVVPVIHGNGHVLSNLHKKGLAGKKDSSTGFAELTLEGVRTAVRTLSVGRLTGDALLPEAPTDIWEVQTRANSIVGGTRVYAPTSDEAITQAALATGRPAREHGVRRLRVREL